MILPDALRELLYREWGETEEAEFVIDLVKEHYEEFLAKQEVEKQVNSYMKVFDSFISEITK